MPVPTQPNGGDVVSVDVLAAKLAQTQSVEEAKNLVAQLRVVTMGHRTSPQQLRNVLPLPALLPWLGNSDLVEDVCAVLAFLLSDLDGESLVPYQQLIEQGLASPIAEVRTVCLEQAQKLPVPSLVPLVWYTVGFEDLVVAEKALKLLERYARNPVSALALYSLESLRVMEDLFERDQTVRYRLLDTVARISSVSDEAFKASIQTGLPQRLVEELNFDGDLLGALAALELCARLVLSAPAGLVFLEQLRILSYLADSLGSGEELVVSNVVKFFGRIGTAMDENPAVEPVFRSFGILDRVQKLMDEPTATLEGNLFVFVENLGSTAKGQALLKAQERLINAFLYTYRSASTEGRLVALHAISVLIEHCPPELSSFAQQIYEDIGRNPPKDLVQLCRSALDESRIAGYSVLKSLAKHPWGLRTLATSPEIEEWLFDRRTDVSFHGMEWKFSIVQAMLESPVADGIVTPELRARLERYVNEGPYFKPTEASVAFLSS